jgi:hypothetical protein
LRLVPGSTAGNPTSGAHSKGELYMDSAARLFVCTKGGTRARGARSTLLLSESYTYPLRQRHLW